MKKLSLLLAAPLVLAACGGSSNAHVKVDSVAYVRHAAHVTAETSEHMTMTAKMSVGPMSITIGGSGDFSSKPLAGSFALNMAVMGKKVKMEEVLDGTSVYVSSPLTSKRLPNGKKWIKLDFSQLGKSSPFNFSALMSRSPTQALLQLEAAGNVTRIGTETVDGVETTRYRVTNLDISKLPQGTKLGAVAHPKFGPIDVWIGNANGFVYRETVAFTFSATGRSAAMTMTVNLSKFGEVVHMTVPPAGETLDATSYMQGKGLGG